MSVTDDLATLRRFIDGAWHSVDEQGNRTHSPRYLATVAALDRVEAELSRLREDNAVLRDLPSREVFRRAEAAEARCARLQQALDEADAIIRRFNEACWNHDGDLPDEIEGAASAAMVYLGDVIRLVDGEALAGPDTPATYDRENHKWVGQCPHGDVCNGCDARGYCTREEGPDTPADSQKTRPIFDAPYGQTINGHSAVILLTEEQIDLILHEFRDVSIVETLACSVKDELRRAKTALARDRADRQPEEDKT